MKNLIFLIDIIYLGDFSPSIQGDFYFHQASSPIETEIATQYPLGRVKLKYSLRFLPK